MKTFSASLAAAYASGGTTLAACMRVERVDGEIFTFTSTDVPVTVGGEAYLPAFGLQLSSLVSQASLAVDNLETAILPDDTSYPAVDILAGRWNNARFWLFECDYTDSGLASGSPIGTGSRNDVNLLKRGTCGDAETVRVAHKLEFRGLKQALQQPLSPVTSKTCRYRLGSTEMPDGLCFVDLAPWTHALTITAIASRYVFTCSAAIQADEHFKEGTVTLTSGLCDGYTAKVKEFAAGVFTLSLPLPFQLQVGDTLMAVAGCQKRLLEDCRDKFDNVLNFGAEPYVPGPDLLMADPEVVP